MKKYLMTVIIFSSIAFSAVFAVAYTNISPEELNVLISDRGAAANMILVDIRTAPEFANGHLEGAANVPFVFEKVPGDKKSRYPNPDFKTQILKIAKDNPGKKIYLICATSHRTEQAANMLSTDPAFGEISIVNVFGGMKGRPGVPGLKDLVKVVQ